MGRSREQIVNYYFKNMQRFHDHGLMKCTQSCKHARPRKSMHKRTHTRAHAPTPPSHTHTHTRTHTYTYVHIRTHTPTHTRTHTYTHTGTHTHVHIRTHTRTHAHAHAHAHAHKSEITTLSIILRQFAHAGFHLIAGALILFGMQQTKARQTRNGVLSVNVVRL